MVTQTDQDALIARYIEPDSDFSTPVRAWMADSSFHVKTVIRELQLQDWDVEAVAAAFQLPVEAVRAATAYYERHKDLFDARILVEDASHLDWETIDAERSTPGDAWMWKHLDFLDGMRTPYEARMAASGARLRTIVRQLKMDDWDIDRVAQSRDLSVEAIRAAIAYYERHKEVIDARILLEDAVFVDWTKS
ncbi:MAG TPA: hypothetical protein VH482_17900 [Thermomicrobiales bacterium]|jgi:uncharacterized protein (DUF433 family)